MSQQWRDGDDPTAALRFGGNEDMDYYRAAQENGWIALGGEAVTIGASSTAMFHSPLAGTKMAVFVVRGNPITATCDGATTPTAGGAGIDYPVGGPFALALNDSELAKVRAIQNGGAASIYAEYWGIP